MQTLVSVPGIHCPSCAALLKDVSSEFPAITQVEVNVVQKTVSLEHDAALDFEAWAAEVATLGDAYKVRVISQ